MIRRGAAWPSAASQGVAWLGRARPGIDPDYAEMARNRIADDGGMFAEVAAE